MEVNGHVFMSLHRCQEEKLLFIKGGGLIEPVTNRILFLALKLICIAELHML